MTGYDYADIKRRLHLQETAITVALRGADHLAEEGQISSHSKLMLELLQVREARVSIKRMLRR